MKRLIVVGSPRAQGRSAHLAEILFEACIDECPEDELYLAPVSELDIAPCIACDVCRAAGEKAARAKLDGAEVARKLPEACDASAMSADCDGDDAGGNDLSPIPYCPRFDDDMLDLYEILADADELTVVAPVFFSGASAPLTALLDRLQPFFWEWLELRRAGETGVACAAQKRPAVLHIVGEGLDRNGYVALVSKVRSAIAPAGFQLERVLDWVGKINEDGVILSEADEYALPPLGKPLAAGESYLLPVDGSAIAMADPEAGAEILAGAKAEGIWQTKGSAHAHKGSARPKLDLGSKAHTGAAKKTGKGGKGNKAGKSATGGAAQRNSGKNRSKSSKRNG